MADFDSRDGYKHPNSPPPDVPGTSHFVHGAQINDPAASHHKDVLGTDPLLQADGNASSNVANKIPKGNLII